MTAFQNKIENMQFNAQEIYFYVHYNHFNKHNGIIHWVKLILILMGTGQMMLHYFQFILIGFDFMWKCM